MKTWNYTLAAALVAATLLSACSKEEAPAPAPEAAPAPVAAPAEPAPVVNEPGGYVPTEAERYHPPADAPAPAPVVDPAAAPAEAAPAAAQ